MVSVNDLRDIFFVEADELLGALDEGLRAIQTGTDQPDTVHAVFRAVHSIKGGAGAFALDALVGFAHRFETVLEGLRSGILVAEPALLAAMLGASDHLADMVGACRQGNTTDPATDERVILALEALVDGELGEDTVEEFSAMPMNFSLMDLGDPPVHPQQVIINLALDPNIFARGHDPYLILRDALALGEGYAALDDGKLPDAAGFDPGQCYLSWHITLETDVVAEELNKIFEFVEGSADIEIEYQEDGPPELVEEASSVIADNTPVLPEMTTVPEPARRPEPAPTAANAAPRQTIRVEIERVDKLVDVLGELVIHQAMLTEAVEQSAGFASVDVERSLDQLRQLSRQIQDSVMAIRAQPVKPLFDRMHRILREAAQAAGKSARLITEGETTEVDRTIIERLADPLTHMLRNAVDHGIEAPDKRERAGKPAEGEIRLVAAHRSGRIIITVQDDGAGIDRDRVKQIAIEKGLIAPNADMSPTEIDALLFMPGFSTASEVSSLSGRGVGMDVVRSDIAALGGRVTISSVRGQGTILNISLPLTLAVLDGMVFEVAGQTLVLPVSSIIETLRPEPSMKHQLAGGHTVLDVRGRCLPLIDVGLALGYRNTCSDCEGEIVIVVERGDEDGLALMVDGIRDQRQVVIKGLQANYGAIRGIAAATVLGDGSVALILDPTDLADNSQERQIFQHAAE